MKNLIQKLPKSTEIFLWILFLLLLTGCAVQEKVLVKDGMQYGVTSGLFRGRWWNYMERGLSFADGGFLPEAIEDFQMAIKQRENDTWEARTYGMHYIHYFPHRELGIMYFKQGNYPGALQELEHSIETAGSSKAHFFINRVRKILLEETKQDVLPPSLQVGHSLTGKITNSLFVDVHVLAEDDHFISSLSIQGVPAPFELSTPKYFFKKRVPLQEGNNTITVEAKDLVGKRAAKTFTIISDRRGPIISLTETGHGDQGFRLQGYVWDRVGISSLSVNQKVFTAEGKIEIEFDEIVEEPTVIIEALDIAGNKTSAHISLKTSASFPVQVPTRVTHSESQISDVDYLGDRLSQNVLSQRMMFDIIKPTIKLKGIRATQLTYNDKFLIEGEVSDDSQVRYLTVNGKELLKRSGGRLFFSYLTQIAAGENIFEVEAKDIFGNVKTKTFKVVRVIPKVKQIGSRLSIAALPLTQESGRSGTGDATYELMLHVFVNQGRFKLIEKSRTDELLLEQKLSSSKLVDQRSALRIGKILAADCTLTGTIIEKKNSIEIIAKLVDVESSEVLSFADVYDENSGKTDRGNLLERLAYKFKEDLPVVEGQLLEMDEKTVTIDMGNRDGLKKNMKLIVFRDGERIIHPLTGADLGVDVDLLGEAKVGNVFEEFSEARIVTKTKTFALQDKVITK